jgi:hypothetical protein
VCAQLAELDGDVAVLLSPKLANEELLVLRRLFGGVYPVKMLGAGSLEPAQPEDDTLRRADPHPNTWAVRALGLEADVRRVVRESRARGLLVFGDDPVRWDPSLESDLAKFAFVGAVLCNRNATAAAVARSGGVLLPLATYMEFAGSFTNFQGRVQRFEPALSLFGSALPGFDLGIEMAHTLGRPFWPQASPPYGLVQQAIWEQLLPQGSTLPRLVLDDLVPAPQRYAQPHVELHSGGPV